MPAVTVIAPYPAISITFRVPKPLLGERNRVVGAERWAGGRGVNVARLLARLDTPVRVTGFLAGEGGEEIRRRVSALPIEQSWIEVLGATPMTVTVASDGFTTQFTEPPIPVGAEDWRRLTVRALAGVAANDVFVLSGACLPTNQAQHLLGMLERARSVGTQIVVDTPGPALLELAPFATVITLDRADLTQATGTADMTAGAHLLLDLGATAVAVSGGAACIDLFTRETHWGARIGRLDGPPAEARGAAPAAFAALLSERGSSRLDDVLPGALPQAVALSGAAFLSPVADDIDPDTYKSLLNDVTMENSNAADQPA